MDLSPPRERIAAFCRQHGIRRLAIFGSALRGDLTPDSDVDVLVGSFARGRSREDLETDRQLVLALVKAVEIIGEAAYRLSPETRALLPDIPWNDIIGMRHRLVHAYFDINLDILWRTVEEDLPAKAGSSSTSSISR